MFFLRNEFIKWIIIHIKTHRKYIFISLKIFFSSLLSACNLKFVFSSMFYSHNVLINGFCTNLITNNVQPMCRGILVRRKMLKMWHTHTKLYIFSLKSDNKPQGIFIVPQVKIGWESLFYTQFKILIMNNI